MEWSLTENDWYVIRSRAFTLIRANFAVEVLIKLAAENDNYTPVDGTMLYGRKLGVL